MFWRRNKQSGPAANKLRDEARPNELSGREELEDEVGDEELDDEELDDEVDATYEEDEEDEEDEANLAERAEKAAALRAELEREAEEFGLTDANPGDYLGPNGEEVARFLDRLVEVPDDELEDRYAAWSGRRRDEKRLTAAAVRATERTANLHAEIEAARGAVNQWADVQARNAAEEGDDAEEFYRAMARAVADAAIALVLREELDEVDFESLGGSWAADVAARERQPRQPRQKRVEEDSGDDEAEDEGEFGPNTEVVTELLNRLEQLTPQEIARLTAAWRAQPKGDLREAHRDMEELVGEDPAWGRQLARAQDIVTTWVSGEAPGVAAAFGRPTLDYERPRAAPAIADAVTALVLGDLLEPENARLLYAPWQQVVGAPELPLADEDDEENGDDDSEEDGSEQDEG